MSLQTYTLTWPVFSLAERSSELVRVKIIDSFRYSIKTLFNCWHLQMGRPFSRGTHTYRTCAKCGMRRDFDLITWKMKGRYYCDPVGEDRLTLLRTREAVAVNNLKETRVSLFQSGEPRHESARPSVGTCSALEGAKTMIKRKTFSNLSIAAIALLWVTVPSFAQAQPDRIAQSSISGRASEQASCSDTELIAVKRKARVATPGAPESKRAPFKTDTRTVSPFMLSASAFKVSGNFNAITSDRWVNSQLIFKDGPKDFRARTQFGEDDDRLQRQGKKAHHFHTLSRTKVARVECVIGTYRD